MLVWSFIPTVSLILTALIPSASASHSNFTLRTVEKRTSSWVSARCATVSGNYLGQNFNFGCLCLDDVDDFCDNNNLNGYLKLLLNYYINAKGSTNSYPPNAQPTCDGAGGYTCGSLTKTSSGCGTSTCDPNKCSTNGGCCPRGQSYNPASNQCCGNVGCNRGQTCSPALGCAGYVSNSVCCTQSDKSWVGQTTICCPVGQSEVAGKCVCPDGQQISDSDSTKCVSSCTNGLNWCTTKCCPSDASEVNGVCQCPAGKKISDDGKTCVSKCTTAGWTWQSTVCCPSGTSEVHGVCKCPDGQTLDSNNVCKSTCTNGMSWCSSKCCPSTATEVNGVCTCPAGQKLSTDGNSCVTACKPGFTWSTSACCPNGSSQVNGGSCSCPSGQTWNAGKTGCITACSPGTQWCTSKCCPSGSSEVNGVCTCPANQKWNAGKTACICSTGSSWCTTKCCPSDATEVNGDCVCPRGQVLNADSTDCVNKCDPGMTWGGNVCCPNGSTEINKVCVCTDSSKQLSPDGKSCAPKCTPGSSWCTSRCCPTGATEKYGQCICPAGTQLSKDSKSCDTVCSTGKSWCQTQCCKSYLVEQNNACVCAQSGFYDDGTKCSQPNCNTGYQYDTSQKKCVPICDTNSGYQYKTGWGGNGMCCLSSHTACNTVCCPAGQSEVDHTGKCCPIGAKLVDGYCVSPTGKPYGSRKRLTGRADEPQFDFGLTANKDSKLCPVGLAACPIPGASMGEYECLDTLNDLQSCGGCASLKTGTDCTAILGAKWMGCNSGKCEVYSCRSGFKRVNGTSCERI